jgi:hypothetical protein
MPTTQGWGPPPPNPDGFGAPAWATADVRHGVEATADEHGLARLEPVTHRVNLLRRARVAPVSQQEGVRRCGDSS